MISKALKQIVPTDVTNKNASSVRCTKVLFFLMEIALVTIPGLQFNDISIFQDWFSKWSNSFAMNPLHFLMSILLTHALGLGLESSIFRISDGWNRARCVFKICTWNRIWRTFLSSQLVPVANLLLWGIAQSFNMNVHLWINTSLVSFCRYITNNAHVAFSLLFSI